MACCACLPPSPWDRDARDATTLCSLGSPVQIGSWKSPFLCTTESTRRQGFGEDTLQELAEKKRFFAALEAGRLSPVDYAALNHQLTLSSTAPLPLSEMQTRNLQSQQSTPLTLSSSSVASSGQRAGSSADLQETKQEGPLPVEDVGLPQGRSSSQSASSYGSETFESGDETSETTPSHTPSTATLLSPQSDVRGLDLSAVNQNVATSDGSHSSNVMGPPTSAEELNSEVSPPRSQQAATEDGSHPAALHESDEVTSGVRGFDLSSVHAVELSGLLPQSEQSGGPGPRALSPVAPSLRGEETQASPTARLGETQRSLSALSTAASQHLSRRPALQSSLRETGDLSDPLQSQSSIEQDLEEVQQALKAVGLGGLDGIEVPSPAAKSADLQLVLRELTTAEVVSMSQELMHQSQGVGSGAGDAPDRSTPPSIMNKGEDTHTPHSSTRRTTAPTADGGPGPPHKSKPTSSKLPIASRRLSGSGSGVCGSSVRPESPTVSKRHGDHTRELKLLEEVLRWQEMWRSEKEQRECVEQERAAQEVQSRQQEELARLTHQDEVQRLKGELFALARQVGQHCD